MIRSVFPVNFLKLFTTWKLFFLFLQPACMQTVISSDMWQKKMQILFTHKSFGLLFSFFFFLSKKLTFHSGSIPKFTSSFHVPSWRRTDDYTMTSTWRSTSLPTCSVQMSVMLLVNDRLYLPSSLVKSQKYSLSTSLPVQSRKRLRAYFFFLFRIPTRPARNVVRRKMLILFFSG